MDFAYLFGDPETQARAPVGGLYFPAGLVEGFE